MKKTRSAEALEDTEQCPTTKCHQDDLPKDADEVHGMDHTLTAAGGYKQPEDSDQALTYAWITHEDTKKDITTILTENIKKAKIFKDETKIEKFVKEWVGVMQKYPKDKVAMDAQQSEYDALIKTYELKPKCSPEGEPQNVEALWSGHISASKFAETADKRRPLESTEFAKVLSFTFGTEWFPKGIEHNTFEKAWLPSFAGMFNTVSLTYSSDMKPIGVNKEEKTLPIYMNQLKTSSVLFDFELNMVLANTEIHNLDFVVVNPPSKKGEAVHKYFNLNVNVNFANEDAVKEQIKGLIEIEQSAESSHPSEDKSTHKIVLWPGKDALITRKKILILDHFRNVDQATVKLMWEKKFALSFCWRDIDAEKKPGEVQCDISHPMNEKAGTGDRLLGKNAQKMYEMFFVFCPEQLPSSTLAVSASLEQSNSSFLVLCTFGLFSFWFVLYYWFSAKQSSQSHLEVEFYNEF